jgi:hypothetical protein
MRIQQDVDGSYRTYIQFSGQGNLHGFSIGTGQSTSPHAPGDIGIEERFRIDSYGNISMNKTVANAKLDVNGDTIVTGSFTVKGNTLTTGNATVLAAAEVGTTLRVGGKATILDVPQSAEASPRILTVSQTSPNVGRVEYITNIVPKGAIMMWGGLAQNSTTPPPGWRLCNGDNSGDTNGVTIPDLRERFIVGAGGNNDDIVTYNYDIFDMSYTGLSFRTGTGALGVPTFSNISVTGTFNKVNNTSMVNGGVFYSSINSGAGNPPGYDQYALYALIGGTPATSFFLVYHSEDKNYRLYRGSVPAHGTNISNSTTYPYHIPPAGSVATLSRVGEFVTYRPNFSYLVWRENTTGYAVGDKGGLVNVKLGTSEIPAHFHHTPGSAFKSFTAGAGDYGNNSSTGTGTDGANNSQTAIGNLGTNYDAGGAALEQTIGGNLPHENRPPYYALAFIIYTGV